MRSWRAALAGIGMLCTAPSLAAASELFDACAREAASRHEPGYEEIGSDIAPGDPAKAIEACNAALTEDPGSIPVKAWLGRAYDANGELDKAIPLLEAAARAGNVAAQTRLGDILIVGDGIEPDLSRGNQLLRVAAEAGFAPALDSLALSYDYGEGLTHDPAEAMRLYRLAAEKGLPRAMTNLGSMYAEGLGLERDIVAASAWYQRAADRGDPVAQYELGKLYETGALDIPDYTRAASYYELAADIEPQAANALGYLKLNGYGTKPDPEGAVALFRRAAGSGLAQAQFNLGAAYEEGKGVARDYALARLYYRQALESGLSDAAVNLGRMYLDGEGIADPAKALEFTQRAAAANNPIGLNNLGHLYEYGLGVEADTGQALALYQQAADLGYRQAADNHERLSRALAAPTLPPIKVYPPSKLDN